jgi:hypothetical protein
MLITLRACLWWVFTASGKARQPTCAVDDEAEKQPTQKVELKGDEKTDILFSGKTTYRTKLTDAANPWSTATAGALTVRQDKASGAAWIQVNNESKVFLYSSNALAVLEK